MTPAAALLRATGLSQSEAAEWLGVRLDSVRGWCRDGGSRLPPGVRDQLHTLAQRQRRAADETLAAITRAPAAAEIEIGYASDDAEAQAMGWPCRAAQWQSLALVYASAARTVRLVPRGSTLATAAAADAHGL